MSKCYKGFKSSQSRPSINLFDKFWTFMFDRNKISYALIIIIYNSLKFQNVL